ncbi:hypothetical protein AB1Y20_002468 [Prymnesium parvum]|uniref:CXXC-type domain-containing protein n=1 Tax=Prymnesium parvum TaxID=97485 RepID=A0AB34JB70_PRYPA
MEDKALQACAELFELEDSLDWKWVKNKFRIEAARWARRLDELMRRTREGRPLSVPSLWELVVEFQSVIKPVSMHARWSEQVLREWEATPPDDLDAVHHAIRVLSAHTLNLEIAPRFDFDGEPLVLPAETVETAAPPEAAAHAARLSEPTQPHAEALGFSGGGASNLTENAAKLVGQHSSPVAAGGGNSVPCGVCSACKRSRNCNSCGSCEMAKAGSTRRDACWRRICVENKFMLANAYMRADKHEDALPLYTQSLGMPKFAEQNRLRAMVLRNRSFCFYKLKRGEEALKDADEACAICPGNSTNHLRRFQSIGLISDDPNEQMRALEEGLRYMEEAERRHEAIRGDHNNLERLRKELKRLQAAAKASTQAEPPNDADVGASARLAEEAPKAASASSEAKEETPSRTPPDEEDKQAACNGSCSRSAVPLSDMSAEDLMGAMGGEGRMPDSRPLSETSTLIGEPLLEKSQAPVDDAAAPPAKKHRADEESDVEAAVAAAPSAEINRIDDAATDDGNAEVMAEGPSAGARSNIASEAYAAPAAAATPQALPTPDGGECALSDTQDAHDADTEQGDADECIHKFGPECADSHDIKDATSDSRFGAAVDERRLASLAEEVKRRGLPASLLDSWSVARRPRPQNPRKFDVVFVDLQGRWVRSVNQVISRMLRGGSQKVDHLDGPSGICPSVHDDGKLGEDMAAPAASKEHAMDCDEAADLRAQIPHPWGTPEGLASVMGRRVKLWWGGNNCYFTGTITKFSAMTCKVPPVTQLRST